MRGRRQATIEFLSRRPLVIRASYLRTVTRIDDHGVRLSSPFVTLDFSYGLPGWISNASNVTFREIQLPTGVVSSVQAVLDGGFKYYVIGFC